MKRVFDFSLSLCGVIALTPLFLLVAVVIKLDSHGAVFFRQERVGLGGKRFQIFKFRTMVNGSSRRGRCFTVRGDQRVTRVGRWLRCTKVDELPQLFNVLRGEMSLVGPRPEVPEYVELFWGEFKKILRSRPGITHRASIMFRNEEELLSTSDDPERFYRETIMPRKLEIYSQAMERDSLADDVRIIIETIFSVARQCPAKEMAAAMEAQAGSQISSARPLRPIAEKIHI